MSTSAWLRRLIKESLSVTNHVGGEELVLAEVLALRAIVINLLYLIGTNSPLTQEAVTNVIASADNDKLSRALAHLTNKEI
jgi:hypothetical protein